MDAGARRTVRKPLVGRGPESHDPRGESLNPEKETGCGSILVFFVVFLTHVPRAELQLADGAGPGAEPQPPRGLTSPDLRTAAATRRRGGRIPAAREEDTAEAGGGDAWVPCSALAAAARPRARRLQLWRHKRQSRGPGRAPQRPLGRRPGRKCPELQPEGDARRRDLPQRVEGRREDRRRVAGTPPRVLQARLPPLEDPQKSQRPAFSRLTGRAG